MNNIPKIIDIASLVIIVLNLAAAAWRGFVKEILNLFGVIIAFSAATTYRDKVGTYVDKVLPEMIIPSNIVGFFILFFFVWIICKLITYFINSFLKASKSLTSTNRMLGGVLGAVKGSLIVLAVLLPLVTLPIKQLLFDVSRSNPTISEQYPRVFKIPEIMEQSRAILAVRSVKGLLFKGLGKSNSIVSMSNRMTKAASEISVFRQAVEKKPEVAVKLFSSPKVQKLIGNSRVKALLSDPEISSIIQSAPDIKQAVSQIMQNKTIMSRSSAKVMKILMDEEVQNVMGNEIDSVLAESGLERKESSEGTITIVDKTTGGEMQIGPGKDGQDPELKLKAGNEDIDVKWAEKTLKKLLQDKTTLEKLYSEKKFGTVTAQKEVAQLINSPKVQNAVQDGNYSVLFFDPKVRALVSNPKVIQFLKDYDKGNFK